MTVVSLWDGHGKRLVKLALASRSCQWMSLWNPEGPAHLHRPTQTMHSLQRVAVRFFRSLLSLLGPSFTFSVSYHIRVMTISPPAATSESSSRRTGLHNSSTPDVSLWTSSLKRHPQCPNSAPTTPVRPTRSRHSSVPKDTQDSAPFPVSGHGVLSRRASEKDSLRRMVAADTLVVPEIASDAPLGPSDPPQIPTRWRSLVISQIADTTCERGAWGVAGSRVVGLRRRSRKPQDPDTNRTIVTSGCRVVVSTCAT